MNAERRLAVVSGANRGIGLEISRQLAREGYRVMMGARDEAKGREAAESLAGEGLDVEAHPLDVADQASVEAFARAVGERGGRVGALVNNAGVIGDTSASGTEADLDEVRRTLETNLFGAWRLSEAIIPLMRGEASGRIVNVSSGMGQLSDMNGGAPAYRVSKTGLNALTRILASELADEGIKVNSACPGWVRTDMGGSDARSSVEEGADTPVWLATLPDDGPTGGFFRSREPIPW
ncbi:MAG: SDR family oxidoreductase [Thermoleophilaceae bacterium]